LLDSYQTITNIDDIVGLMVEPGLGTRIQATTARSCQQVHFGFCRNEPDHFAGRVVIMKEFLSDYITKVDERKTLLHIQVGQLGEDRVRTLVLFLSFLI
jgi:hypothetical protein